MAIYCLMIAIFGPSATAQTHSPNIKSQTSSPDKTYFFGLSMITENVGRYSEAANGASGSFGNIYPALEASGRFHLFGQWSIAPGIDFTPLGPLFRNVQADSATSDNLLLLSTPISYRMDIADIHLGPGLLFDFYSGSGGTSSQSNGTKTSTFYLPSRTSDSRQVVVDLGSGVQHNNYRLDGDLLVCGLLSSRRALDFMIHFSMGLL